MENKEQESKSQAVDAQLTHTLNVRRVPHRVWTRARVNATISNLAFREYVIRVLEQSKPFASQPGSE